jgi:hypothetical protein
MIARSILGLCLVIGLTACYPGRSVDNNTEFASVTTLLDKEASFSTIKTYALPDTVLYVPRNEDGTQVPAATQAAVLQTLRSNLNALGWTEVANARTTPVDAYVVAAITTETNVYWGYAWWGYWGWYPYWPVSWGASTNWYYPPYWYSYSYSTGTLMVGMVNGKPPTGEDERVPLVWTAAVNGVLADASTNLAIATAGIDQAFQQSPYLGGTAQK